VALEDVEYGPLLWCFLAAPGNNMLSLYIKTAATFCPASLLVFHKKRKKESCMGLKQVKKEFPILRELFL